MKRLKFNFFNGKELFNNLLSYSGDFNNDYSILKKSYVEISNRQNFLFEEGTKYFSTFNNNFSEEELSILAKRYGLEIKENISENTLDIYIYNTPAKIIRTQYYDIIYKITGSREPEHIYIYGVFERE